MTVTLKVLVPSVQMGGAPVKQYTAPIGTKVIIDKATVTNFDTANRTFSVHLVPSGGTEQTTNLVIDARAVSPEETYLCPELVGQILAPGDFISTFASSATGMSIRISGREVT